MKKGCKIRYKEPEERDLVTPMYGVLPRWLKNCSLDCDCKEHGYYSYFSPFGVFYYLEAGDYEIVYNFSKKKPTKWQLLVLRFKIWRMRRKIRKALKNK